MDNGSLSGSWPLETAPRRFRVIVADDDPDLRTAIVEAMRQRGADVLVASSGAELVQRLASGGRVDLLISDIAMPWMTGLQAMEAARAAGFALPAIFMTALRDDTLAERVRALGGRAVLLRKPFALADLEAAVSDMVSPPRG
jgi:CheY-like chemotaxis protein